ncbi:MAG: hypothetical protein KA052_01215 [Candidatus Pacebacteria bacterium]|nr:hypothetical protein [Candidatus Paceibacterota bacterium]
MKTLIILSSIFALVGPALYIFSIVKGKAQPHRMTRFVLMIVVLVATFSFYAAGDTPTFIMSAVLLVGNIAMFLLSIKYGVGGWAKSDILCLIIAIIGIILWQVSGNPLLSIYSLVVADLVAMLPTIIKSYRRPDTEVWYLFFCDILANICILAAHKEITFNEYVYPGYLVLVNIVVVLFIMRKRTHLEI